MKSIHHICTLAATLALLIGELTLTWAGERQDTREFRYEIRPPHKIKLLPPYGKDIDPNKTRAIIKVTKVANVSVDLNKLGFRLLPPDTNDSRRKDEPFTPTTTMNDTATFDLPPGSIGGLNGNVEYYVIWDGLELEGTETIRMFSPKGTEIKNDIEATSDSMDQQLSSKGFVVLKFRKLSNVDAPVPEILTQLRAQSNTPVYVSITDPDTNTRYALVMDSVREILFQPEKSLAGSIAVLKSSTGLNKNELHQVFYLGSFEEGSKVDFSMYRLLASDSISRSRSEVMTSSVLGAKVDVPKGGGKSSVPTGGGKSSASKSGGKSSVSKGGGKSPVPNGDEGPPPLDSLYVRSDTMCIKTVSDYQYVTSPPDFPGVGKLAGTRSYSTHIDTTTGHGIVKLDAAIFKLLSSKTNDSLSARHNDTIDRVTFRWARLPSFELNVPRYYRFRLWAGFAYSAVEHRPFGIQSVTDTTSAIYHGSNDEVTVSPVLFLSAYIFPRDLEDNHSLFDCTPWDAWKTLSLTLGVPISARIGQTFYAGGSIEALKGVNLTLGVRNYKESVLEEGRQIETPYPTKRLPADANNLLKNDVTKWKIYYALSIDIAVFAKAFKGLFSFTNG